MEQTFYFLKDGTPLKAFVKWQEVPAPDAENPVEMDALKREVDGAWYVVSGYTKSGIWDVPRPEQVNEVVGVDYTDAEFKAKFEIEVTDPETGAVGTQSIAPNRLIKPARNEDGALADGFVNASRWDGPAAWTLQDGVQEITFDEYAKLVSGEARAK